MARLTINGSTRDFHAEPDIPLLWALREQLGLIGTKFGCVTDIRIRAGIKRVAELL